MESSDSAEGHNQGTSIAARDEAESTDSLQEFIKALPAHLASQQINASVRLTPHGLFVEEAARAEIVSAYRAWLSEKTRGQVEKSEAKAIKRLFGSLEPRLYYLVESKRCFVGYLVTAAIPQPQNWGLPFYLGSLDEAAKTIHPRDPLLMCLPHLDAKKTARGTTYGLELEDQHISFALSLLEDFTHLAKHSAWLSRKLPAEDAPLRDGLRLMLEVIQRSRRVGRESRTLVPLAAKARTNTNIVRSGTVFFLLDQSGCIERCYETVGRGLFHFIRAECAELSAAVRGKRVGSLTLSHPRDKMLGLFQPEGKDYPLMPHALLQFIEAVHEHPGRGATSAAWFTVQDAICEFSEEFLRSERIEKSKIDRHIEANPVRADSYRMFERWIFFLNSRREIVGCSDRFHRAEHSNTGHKKKRKG